MKNINKNNQLGRTMLEMLLVLGIIAIIAAAIFATISKVYSSITSTRATSELVSLANAIFNRYSLEGVYTGVSTQKLLDDNVVPINMVSNGNIINAKKDVLSVSEVSLQPDLFMITVPNVSKLDCADYLSIQWYNENTVNISSIKVGATTFRWPGSYLYDETTDKKLPVAAVDASSVCKETNTIIWEFN